MRILRIAQQRERIFFGQRRRSLLVAAGLIGEDLEALSYGVTDDHRLEDPIARGFARAVAESGYVVFACSILVFGLSDTFWISLVAVPAAVAAHTLIPPSPPARRPKIDWLGAAVLSVGLGAVLIGLALWRLTRIGRRGPENEGKAQPGD